MKTTIAILLISAANLHAGEVPDRAEIALRHAAGSEKLSDEQDELSADVQQLVIEQTDPKVIKLLGEVEEIMDETTDYLLEADTGGDTIAAQTEVIEKIHEAAKEKQKKGGQGKAGGAMMDMMERMMGKKEGEGEGEGKGKGKGKGAGNEGGEGMTGESDTANSGVGGNSGDRVEQRTVPKAAGKTGKNLPDEFQKALDAYNRGLEEVGK
ncbi:hypothetical protein HZ994_17315 [Akkermansiaceae bacterium]|nr:hypothetical protein HZ994_17315 [Akkermansiaceae bacterium]